MKVGDTFQLDYCPSVTFKLKRIDKTTKIHTFQHPDGKEFIRKETEVDFKRWGWVKIN